MTELILEFIKTLDIGQLVAMSGVGWFFYSRLGKRFDDRFDRLEKRTEKIEEKVIDIDKRLFAVETMLHMKDCCMLKEERHHKVAS